MTIKKFINLVQFYIFYSITDPTFLSYNVTFKGYIMWKLYYFRGKVAPFSLNQNILQILTDEILDLNTLRLVILRNFQQEAQKPIGWCKKELTILSISLVLRVVILQIQYQKEKNLNFSGKHSSLMSHLENATMDLCLLHILSQKSILKNIFLCIMWGVQGLENEEPNIIRKGKPMIHTSSDSKRDGLSKIPKTLEWAGYKVKGIVTHMLQGLDFLYPCHLYFHSNSYNCFTNTKHKEMKADM